MMILIILVKVMAINDYDNHDDKECDDDAGNLEHP